MTRKGVCTGRSSLWPLRQILFFFAEGESARKGNLYPSPPPASQKRPIKPTQLTAAHKIPLFSKSTLMSATHHALAYHPSTPPTTHALRKAFNAATTTTTPSTTNNTTNTTTRVQRPISKNLGRSKIPNKGTKAKSIPAPEEDDNMGSSFLQFWYVLLKKTFFFCCLQLPSYKFQSPIANVKSHQRHV